jgi:hypothetical protein
MRKTVLIPAAILLTACGGTATDNGANAAATSAASVPPRAKSAAQASAATATVRDFQQSVDRFHEFRLGFGTEAAARRAYGPAVLDALAVAGIRYVPSRQQFRDARRAYAPLIAIDRGGRTDVIVVMNALEGDEVSLCIACSSNVGLVQSGRVTDLGGFDNNGMGSTGSVSLLAQSGPIIVLGFQVGYYMQGESGASATLRVIGERGVLAPEIPLFRESSYDSSFLTGGGESPSADEQPPEDNASAPPLRSRIRLGGDRLTVLYPDARPNRAVFRIGPARLELIEGRVPAALTQD